VRWTLLRRNQGFAVWPGHDSRRQKPSLHQSPLLEHSRTNTFSSWPAVLKGVYTGFSLAVFTENFIPAFDLWSWGSGNLDQRSALLGSDARTRTLRKHSHRANIEFPPRQWPFLARPLLEGGVATQLLANDHGADAAYVLGHLWNLGRNLLILQPGDVVGHR
jgi:hypothetical protein